MPDNEQTKKNWLNVNVSQDALIRKLDKVTVFRMPNDSEYAGNTYLIFNNRVKSATQIVDMKSDDRELSYRLTIPAGDIISLRDEDGNDSEITAEEFKNIVDGTTNKDYYKEPKEGATSWFSPVIPQDAIVKEREKSTLFKFPNNSSLAGYTFGLPNSFFKEAENGEDGAIRLSLPGDLEVTAYKYGSDERVKVSAHQIFVEMQNSTPEQYKNEYRSNEQKKEQPQKTENDNKEKGNFRYVLVSADAKLREKDNSTLFKMPNGEFNGYSYFIPNNLLQENKEKGTIRISLPEGFVVKAKNNRAEKDEEKTVEFTVDNFIEQVKGKTDKDYTSLYKPSESKPNPFAKVEDNLVNNIPKEMKNRPNWVAVKVWYNKDKERHEKRPINCKNGDYAEADNPNSWTDFDSARKYARENGHTTLAYALDGKDGICCIDIDNCYKDGKEHSPLVTDLIQKSDGTYRETSLSGKGVHFFGKTKGMDVRTFSKTGDIEFYQKNHFIAVTGDTAVKSNGIVNFDNTEVETLIKEKCEKRTELKGAGKGVEGLSRMSDRDVVEKAIKSKGGDTFKDLYDGKDLQNNHSNSDMSLMNRLAFWCNGDKEQMLRIFTTSGLYRPNKSPDYYECTVIKAIRDTTERFQPSQKANNAPKPVNGNSSGRGGK